MAQFLLERGGVAKTAFDIVERSLRATRGSTIYWVSYNAHAKPDLAPLFKAIRRSDAHIRLLVRHPSMAVLSERIITSETLRYLQENKVEVRGLKSDRRADGDEVLPDDADIDGQATDDDEDEGYGKTHAKWIVGVLDGRPMVALLGSFNASRASMTSSCESLLELNVHAPSEQDAAMGALVEAERLWHRAVPIEPDECNDDDAERGAPPPVGGSPGETGSAPPTRKFPPEPALWNRDPFGPLLKLLAQKLREYRGGWQWDVYGALDGSGLINDLLYLPVGCGKTFIALYWLVKKLAASASDCAAYIAPNRWIERTVQERLDGIYRMMPKAQRLACEARLKVARASTLKDEDRNRLCAAVADEVHNWSPRVSAGLRSYTGLLDALRDDQVPILGLSATPCRMEARKFDVTSFVNSWVGDDRSVERHRPFATVAEMTAKGVIAPLRFQALTSDPASAQEITAILDRPEIEMGDYSKVCLRNVWHALVGTPQRMSKLVASIVEGVTERHRSTRVVVFLPPVGDDEYGPFLRALTKALDRAGALVFDFIAHPVDDDHRSLTGKSANAVFQKFAEGDRSDAQVRVLLTIDRFSEGVSVDDIDMLVMLRATLSPRVAVQQIGRGVRTSPGKTECVVLDAVRFEQRWNEWESPAGLRVSAEDGDAGQVRDVASETDSLGAGDEGAGVVDEVTPPPDWEEIADATVSDARAASGPYAAALGLHTGDLERAIKGVHGGTKLVNALGDAAPRWLVGVGRANEALGRLAGSSLADVRERRLIEEELAAATGISNQRVRKILHEGHGRTRIDNAFGDSWPIAASSGYVGWYVANRMR
ncbi:MAG: hypothetical protein IT383_01150 [Deltaproteobacteria bacterium]|nr:hypothetical protein [Deltaproteobacteria bacterium]